MSDLLPIKKKVKRVQGTVEKIWHNRRADGTEYWVLTIDGKRYSTWDSEHVAYIREGESVEFAFTQSGRFLNLTAIRRIDGTVRISSDKIRVNNECRCNVRINCLRTAAEMLKGSTSLPEQKVDLAINMAQNFEKYVLLPIIDYTPNGAKTIPESNQTGNKNEGKT